MNVDRKNRCMDYPGGSGVMNPQNPQASSSVVTGQSNHSVSGPSRSSGTVAPFMPEALQHVASTIAQSLPQGASGWQDTPLPVFKSEDKGNRGHRGARWSEWYEPGDLEMSDALTGRNDGKRNVQDQVPEWPASISRALGALPPALAELNAELVQLRTQLTRETGLSSAERAALGKAIAALDHAGTNFGEVMRVCPPSGVPQGTGLKAGPVPVAHADDPLRQFATLHKLFEPCRDRAQELHDACARLRKAIPEANAFRFDARALLADRWAKLEVNTWLKVRALQSGLLRLRALVDQEKWLARSAQPDWPAREGFQSLRQFGCGFAGPGYAQPGPSCRTPEPLYAQVLTMKTAPPQVIAEVYGHCALAKEAERLALAGRDAGCAMEDGDFEMDSAQSARVESGQGENKGSTFDTRAAEAVLVMAVAERSLRALADDPLALLTLRTRLHREHVMQSIQGLTAIVGTTVPASVPWRDWCGGAAGFLASLETSRLRICEAARKIGSLSVTAHPGRGGYTLAPAAAARIAAYASAVRDHHAALLEVALCLHQGRLDCLDACERLNPAARLRLEHVLKFQDDCLIDVYSDLKWAERETLQLPPLIMMPDNGASPHRHVLRRKGGRTGVGPGMLH